MTVTTDRKTGRFKTISKPSTQTSTSEGEQLAASYDESMQVRIDRDALEQQPVLEPAQPAIGRKVSSPELSALASKYMAMTDEQLEFRFLTEPLGGARREVMRDLRRLAASVLSQDESK